MKAIADDDWESDEDMLLIQEKIQVDKAIRARLRSQIQSLIVNESETDNSESNASFSDTEMVFQIQFEFID